jgi:hypothetical protein
MIRPPDAPLRFDRGEPDPAGRPVATVPHAPLKVLFVVGSGRSGSTLLDILLGQVEGVFSTGELHSIWSESILDGRRCGCGDPVLECRIWRAVLERCLPGGAFGASAYQREARRLATLHRSLSRRPGPPTGAGFRARAEYAGHAAFLYGTIREVTGARVVVDSSKHPSVGGVLPAIAGVQPHFVHLIRDPRAVAYSWRRRKVATDRYGIGEMDRYIVPRTALRWARDQRAAEALRRRTAVPWLTLRYEDLVAEPRRTVERVLAIVGEPEGATFLEGRVVRLRPTHTVSGNPVRLHEGSLTIEPDDEWRARMRPSRRRLVTLLTAPLLRRYGYPLMG